MHCSESFDITVDGKHSLRRRFANYPAIIKFIVLNVYHIVWREGFAGKSFANPLVMLILLGTLEPGCLNPISDYPYCHMHA